MRSLASRESNRIQRKAALSVLARAAELQKLQAGHYAEMAKTLDSETLQSLGAKGRILDEAMSQVSFVDNMGVASLPDPKGRDHTQVCYFADFGAFDRIQPPLFAVGTLPDMMLAPTTSGLGPLEEGPDPTPGPPPVVETLQDPSRVDGEKDSTVETAETFVAHTPEQLWCTSYKEVVPEFVLAGSFYNYHTTRSVLTWTMETREFFEFVNQGPPVLNMGYAASIYGVFSLVLNKVSVSGEPRTLLYKAALKTHAAEHGYTLGTVLLGFRDRVWVYHNFSKHVCVSPMMSMIAPVLKGPRTVSMSVSMMT